MSTQIVQHKSRDFEVVLNFPETENPLSWSFTAESDGEIYAVDLVNVASYQIAGAPVTLPYAVTAGASYSVTIIKQTNGQPATISFNTRRAVNKSVSISVPDFGSSTGELLYVIENQTLHKIDVSRCNALNYAGSGAWIQDLITASYTMPNISVALDYEGVAGNFRWRSLVFVNVNNTPYLFCLAETTPIVAGSRDFIVSFFRISDGIFLQKDLLTPGTSRVSTGYGNIGIVGALIYDYVNQKIIIARTIGPGNATQVTLYDIASGTMGVHYDASSVPGVILGQSLSDYKFRLSYDPFAQEFIGRQSRIKMPSQSNRNLMEGRGYDSTYIKSTGEIAVIAFNNRGVYLYNSIGAQTRSLIVPLNQGLSGGGFILNSNDNIIWAPRDNGYINITNIAGTTPYQHLTTGLAAGHTGFRGAMISNNHNKLFAWGRVATESGKRLYIYDTTKRDASFEIGYFNFTKQIEDIYTDQLL